MLWWLVPTILIALVLATAAVCFFLIFYATRPKVTEEFPTPPGPEYDEYRERMVGWVKAIRAMDRREVSVTSHDCLQLYGYYYEYQKGAPIEILFHGYKGTAERDLCGGVERAHRLGHNALIVDQRAASKSEGRVITFGHRESRDCHVWIDFVLREIDEDARIILAGISMGAATVMTAAGTDLPKNVIGILADCGYTSTRDIVQKVMRDMHLPDKILYPFARLGAMLFGGFDPDRTSPIESMKKTKLPVIFFHGDADDFVPAYMSEENYAACASEYKRLVIIEGAVHGTAYPKDEEKYITEARAFFTPLY